MLKKYSDEKFILKNLRDIEIFHSLEDREYWDRIKEGIYGKLLEKKEYFDNYTFEPLYASLWMQFTTIKNRSNFQKKQFERRTALNVYALLEAIENKGEYMERIIDLVWMTLEETEWALPAHVNATPSSDALPYYKEPTVCIFSSATACQLAFVYSLFKEKFDAVSKNIAVRIKEEVTRRVIDDFMARDYWYMGFHEGERTSNWTSGVNVGVMAAAIAFVDDKKKLARIVSRILSISSNQLNGYPDDGACDEGVSYWLGSTLCLVETLDYIRMLTGGAVDPFAEKKLINISNYLNTVYIYGSYLANFSDCDAVCNLFRGSLYKIGKICGNPGLISVENDAFERERDDIKFDIGLNIQQILNFAECYAELSRAENIPPHEPKADSYLESIQVMSARESTKDCSGLYFAAKAGHNYEMHNHNDVGSFIVYKDGERFLCDAGRAEYNARTFTRERYTIWNNRSCYHNLPTVNGADQHDSEYSEEHFTSKNVSYKAADGITEFSLELQEAYENKADIERWIRSFVFDRKKRELKITEDYSLKKCESIVLNFISAVPFKAEDDGILMVSASGKSLKIFIDTSLFNITTEKIYVGGDAVLGKMWDEYLYRICLEMKEPKPVGKIIYTIA